MTITNEAAYLYVYSKKLISINRRIHSLREDGRKALEKFHQTNDSSQKEKYRRQSRKAADKLKKTIEEKQNILTKLHRHQVAFAGQLRNEAGK